VNTIIDGATGTQNVIDVCICTYRRDSLEETLQSISRQSLPLGWRARVIVADNDATSHRRQHLERYSNCLGIEMLYVHAPEKNISRARNACLSHASAKWVAFIDDDETARHDWLAQLISRRGEAHCIFGVARALYEPSAPSWMVKGDFHSHVIRTQEALSNGSTCNVMIDREFIERHGLRFNEDLGRVGGEDTILFHEMALRGATFCFAHLAIVEERVSPARATIKWLALRRFRSGQIHFMILKMANQRRLTIAVSASAKVIYCALGALLSLSTVNRVARALRGSLHLGVLASAIGASLYEEYS